MQARSRGHAFVEVGCIDSKRGLRAADAYILCKERGNEGEAMMLAVATYFDQIKQFAASENPDPPRSQNNLGWISTK